MNKPFSQACENNKQAILDIIKPILKDREQLLEVGSGTGQHAVHFAAALPHLTWQCSDRENNLLGIQMWLDEAQLTNTPKPLTLDVNQSAWPLGTFDVGYSANTAHIIHWPDVVNFFSGIKDCLNKNGKFLLYGPMKYRDAFTSESNARFDQHLKQQDPDMGIRDFEALDELARDAGLRFVEDHSMPANNQLLHWEKIEGS